MNKYDEKILGIASAEGTIHELIRRPIRSPFYQFVDILLDNVLFVADGLSSKGAYYLLVKETEADLIHIDRNLNVSRQDVTSVIQAAANKKSFKFEGNKYKLCRKVR